MRIELTAEQEAFRQTAADFAERAVRPLAGDIDSSDRVPAALVEEAARLGLLGVTLAPNDGGAGRDTVSYAVALEAVASASASVAMILAVQNTVAEVVAHFGSEAQRSRWLKRLISGRSVGAAALIEAGGGSGAVPDEAGAPQGRPIAWRDGDGYVLRGGQPWVANAAAGDVFLLFADSVAGDATPRPSAFLVPGDAPGLDHAARRDTLGVRGLGCGDVVLEDVRLGADARLGAPEDGGRVGERVLDGTRVATGAAAVGVGQAAFEEALAYAGRTQAGGASPGRRQSVRSALSDTATDLDAARLLVLKAAAARDQQERSTQEAAMAKLVAAEAAQRAAERTMQLLAVGAYERGSTAERLLRDARAAEICHGTASMQRSIIAAELLGEAPAVTDGRDP